ncbi:MAG TPA: hypothetical protein VGQ35_10790 [Dongiaceae bacterium]|jgi:hypothetical protein|nr:hypothetical protein [Dongiaceae bacterium]
MKSQDHGANFEALASNIIAFPGTHRGRPATTAEAGRQGRQPAAIAGAELNARLLILFAICTTSAAVALSAVHILQG